MDWLEDIIDKFETDTRKERRKKEKEEQKKRNESEQLRKKQKKIEDRFKEYLKSTIFPMLVEARGIVKEKGYPCILKPDEEKKLKNTVTLKVSPDKKNLIEWKKSKKYQISFTLEPNESNIKVSMSFKYGSPEKENIYEINKISKDLIKENLHYYFEKVFLSS